MELCLFQKYMILKQILQYECPIASTMKEMILTNFGEGPDINLSILLKVGINVG